MMLRDCHFAVETGHTTNAAVGAQIGCRRVGGRASWTELAIITTMGLVRDWQSHLGIHGAKIILNLAIFQIGIIVFVELIVAYVQV